MLAHSGPSVVTNTCKLITVRRPTYSLAILTLLAAPRALAGNQGSAFLSNEAAMTAGAVVAVVDDAGAAWYNPAGLAALDRSSLDLSASAFVLRHYDIPDAAKTSVGNGPVTTQAASFTEIVSVPSALTYVRSLGADFTGAVGVFVPDAEDLDVHASFDSGAAPTEYRWNLTATRRTATYMAGPSLGWKVAPPMHLGVGLFGIYHTSRTARVFQSTLHAPVSAGVADAVQSLERTTHTRQFGGMVTVGIQLDPGAGWRLAAVLRSPQWLVGAMTDRRESTTAATVDPSASPVVDGTASTDSDRGTDWKVWHPPRATFAAGRILGRGWVSVEGDLQPGLTDEDVRRRSLWNLRLGGLYAFSDDVSLGAGVFTDRSPEPAPSTLGDIQIDYHGVTVGGRFNTMHMLREQPGDILFSTTFALRYARGKGEVGGLRFDSEAAPVAHEAEVRVHEVGVHVGSAVEF